MKVVNHGKSKFFSNYGGVGSLIETEKGSILIETFDKWNYPEYYKEEIKKFIIIDDRLISRLKTRFPQLRHLVQIPSQENHKYYEKNLPKPSARFFPQWFYCPKCKRFKKYNEWKEKHPKKDNFNLQCFNPDCKNKNTDTYTNLIQVRFVMTCDNGHIQDLPWDYWNNRKQDEEPNSNNIESEDVESKQSKILISYDYKCCTEQELTYNVSHENTDLSGIHISCKNCGKTESLKGIFGFRQNCGGLKHWLGLSNKESIKEPCNIEDNNSTRIKNGVKLKSSNSLYYANCLSSLWIPKDQILTLNANLRVEIEEIINYEKYKYEDLENFAGRKKIPIEFINNYIDKKENTEIPESVYRKAEYDYFINDESPENKMIRFRKINVQNDIYGFEKIIKIDKLKKIVVQTSFTRNEPIDLDSILIGDTQYPYKIKRQSVSKNNFDTKILPAIEYFGEGILFVLDNKILAEWEKKEAVINRVNLIKDKSANSDWQSHKEEAKKTSARKILIHTLSHLLIKELEYVCGYPKSSLQERLYVNEDMHGFLISAFDGTNGFIGGLAKICNDIDKLQKIIKSALENATECSLDPICYESEGQGIANINLAACHSCTLLPEISCEMNNLFLDRKLVLDNEIGYFN